MASSILYQDDDVTVVEAEVVTPVGTTRATGVARRRPGDRRNPTVGLAIAMARALDRIADAAANVAADALEANGPNQITGES